MKETSNIVTGMAGHLSDEEIALCSQEMAAGRYPENVPLNAQDHLNTCAVCKTAVLELYYLIADEPAVVEAIKPVHRLEPRPEFKQSDQKIRSIKPPHKMRWYAAAAIALIIVAVSAFFILNQKPSPEKLFAQYYSPYSDVVTSKSPVGSNYLLDGLFYYNIIHYDSAIAKFSRGLQIHPENQDLIFYLASSHLAQGNFKAAIFYYQPLLEPGSKYFIPSRWYLAMAYLGSKDVNEARKLLEPIREEGGFYSQKAGKILEQLR